MCIRDRGNLLNRVVTTIGRYRGGNIPTPGSVGSTGVIHHAPTEELQQLAEETRQRAAAALNAWDIGTSLGIVWGFVRRTNQYIEQSEPWKLARQPENKERLDTVLYSAAEALRLLSIFLAPYIPAGCSRIRDQLGLEPLAEGAWIREGTWGSSALAKVSGGPLLFPRIE